MEHTATPVRVLIPDGDSPFAIQVAQCLKRGDPSLRVEASFVDPRALGRFSRFIDRCHRIQGERAVEQLVELIGQGRYDVLLPVSGPGISLVSTHLEQLASHIRVVAVPSPEQLDRVNDKWQFFQHLASTGIPTPKTVLVEHHDSADHFDAEAPIILKPRSGSGGHGIVRIDRAGGFKARAAEFMGPGNPYIMQEFVVGHDIDESVLCHHGQVLAASVQEGISTKHGFAPSGSLHFHHDRAVEQLVVQLMATLDWNGIGHIDLRYAARDGRPMVIEVNPRYWSTMMGSLVAGVNFPLIHIRTALELDPGNMDLHECRYVSAREWPVFRLKHGVPFRQTSLAHALADPLAKVMKRLRPSTALGGDRA